MLFQDDKDTKFESNSQRRCYWPPRGGCCFRTTKIQNLRAIHNNSYANQMALAVVSGRQRYKIWEQFTTPVMANLDAKLLFQDDKDTKFESNSQRSVVTINNAKRCFRTTKIQNLRAIHNQKRLRLFWRRVVSGRQRYKIWEQFTTAKTLPLSKRQLFQDDKDTKFESNSQLI